MSIAINPQNDQELFLGTNVHGVYKSIDGGAKVGKKHFGEQRRSILQNVTMHTQLI